MGTFNVWRAGIGSFVLLWITFTTSTTTQETGPPLVEPTVITATRGVIDLALEAAPSVVTVAGQTYVSNVYNGQYTPQSSGCNAVRNCSCV
jgi:hypothetical protein